MTNQYNIKDILAYLPHRYPFILIDRILELEPGKRVRGLKNVTINEPFFQGHFPDNPIMPGVMIIEAMAQAGGVLAIVSQPEQSNPHKIFFMGIERVKFRKPVIPGDQLLFEIRQLKRRGNVVKMDGTATVDGEVVAEGVLMASVGDKV
jgi:beta-hydroxyacyl-ACP dehydratase FabZ